MSLLRTDWEYHDRTQATKEGWRLAKFNNLGDLARPYHIHRNTLYIVHHSKRYGITKHNKKWLAFVQAQADAGSELHLKALALMVRSRMEREP
jgi:exopolyphosphatase/pppGpp-phosphohydrolase